MKVQGDVRVSMLMMVVLVSMKYPPCSSSSEVAMEKRLKNKSDRKENF